MTGAMVEVMVAVLYVLAIITREIKQNRGSKLATVIDLLSWLISLQKCF